MKNKNNHYEELIKTIMDCDNVNIYIDEANGKYEYQRVGCEPTGYKYIDRIDTDGVLIEEDVNSCFLEEASYALIKTYENRELKKVSAILSLEAYGMVSSYVLQKCDSEKILKFATCTKGNLNQFEKDSATSNFTICPVVENPLVVRKLEY